jgi:phospholipid transport system substrate-binding protein
MTTTHHHLSRRDLLGRIGGAALAATGLSATALHAQTPDTAAALVNAVMADVMGVIGSGRSEAAMVREFERIFAAYADVPIIAQSVIGPPWRSASAADRRAFTEAFQGYMARKYGRQFRDFVGGQIVITGARPVRSFVEVATTARVPGQAPYDVSWLVSDGSGRTRFFNIIIAGVNLMVTERSAVGAMLDARGGDLGRLAADMRAMG